jgi:hypothetical protein
MALETKAQSGEVPQAFIQNVMLKQVQGDGLDLVLMFVDKNRRASA